MEVLSLVGGSLLSATFDLLFEKLNGYLSDQLRDSKEEVRAQMKYWKTLLPKITAVLQHAEENQVANQFVNLYLDDLRDLAYGMEDLLEEFVIDAKRSELIAESEARASKRQKLTSSVMNLFKSKAKLNQEINSMANDLSGRLQKIENELHTLGLINLALKLEDKSHKVVAKRLPESSLLEDKVLGRDSDKDAILRRLLEDGGSLEQDFVIPIVGMGGLGKTTLARLIYNDEKLKDRFELKAWVCVSDEFDVARITRTILEHVTEERCDFDFGLLQEKLKRKLSGCKFFLVLDDVWNEKYGQWDVLRRPFMSGAPGSKIIVTTRNKNVGKMMRGGDGVYNLELLQDDACLPIFTWHALGKENFDAHPDLQDVGVELVKRCNRLPLALQTLGGILRGKLSRDEWENILNSEIWSSSEDSNEILPALRLSYNHLPSHLKRCFAYCALFPKDYEFDEKKLVLLWMAEGLLYQQPHGKKQMEEETGHQYFQELFSRSLFQQSSRDKSRFVMHDLINDLAVDVAEEIYSNLERCMGDDKIEKARHLSFIPHHDEMSKIFPVLGKLKHLRTFFPLGSYFFHGSNNVLLDFLPTLNRLRVLSLCKYGIRKLPDSFENLKHIRYIDLSHTKIQCIPESVDSLLFLQTLLLSGCHWLTKLPRTIGNLIDLHHLDITYTEFLKEMPSEICNLKNLVTLSKIIVGKASGLMRLSDLKNLSKLRGSLIILDLQNVLNVHDAKEANLHKIHGLEELILEWTTSDNDQGESVLEEQVLMWLKPHSNLRSLKISCYGGENFPKWFCDPSLFSNLSSMELSNCKRCSLLPSLGLLPVLKKLIIKDMEAIEAVDSKFCGGPYSFPSLEELVFKNMLNWKLWTFSTGNEGEFPCLHTFVIQNCPKLLGKLPRNLPSFKELNVRHCNAMLLKSAGDLPSLVNLRIEGISELTCLPESFIQSCAALETLDITCCNDLTCLWEEGAESLPEMGLCTPNFKRLSIQECKNFKYLPNTMYQLKSLRKLQIWGCIGFEFIPDGGLPPNLTELQLYRCENLKSMPNTMYQLKSLQKLEVDYWPGIEFIPDGDLPPNLTELRFFGCENLKSLPNTMYQLTLLQHLMISGGALTMGLQNLTSLQRLGIDQQFPLDIVLPSSLTDLWIGYQKNLEYIPGRIFQNLNSLRKLSIISCPKLRSLPREAFPPSLGGLYISECPLLKRQRFEVKGDYWTLTRSIPCVVIEED